MSLSPISSMACCQDTLVHWPFTSFIGYFRRRSPCTSSRTDAPLAQCEPRLIGESQPGSWPIHTPLATSATTVQPTEQCVQMFLRMVTATPAGGGRTGLRLAHAAERQRAERGEAAGDQPGAAQEGAAIEAAFPLRRQRAGE